MFFLSLRPLGRSLGAPGSFANLGFFSRAKSLRPFGTCLFAGLRRLRRIKKSPSLPARPPALHRKLRAVRLVSFAGLKACASLVFLACRRASSLRCGVSPSGSEPPCPCYASDLRGLLASTLRACDYVLSRRRFHAVHATTNASKQRCYYEVTTFFQLGTLGAERPKVAPLPEFVSLFLLQNYYVFRQPNTLPY